MRKKNNKFRKTLFALIIVIFIGIVGYFNPNFQQSFSNAQIIENATIQGVSSSSTSSFDLANIPDYSGEPYVFLDNNKPNFDESDLKAESFEYYSNLDSLGRCGVAFACLSIDTMPSASDERESISSIEPSGWINKKYDNIDGGYLYNRCHLIGYQLSNENANEKNLITGTRYMNTEGMLPFENKVADYIKETSNHVLYRVTPIFDGDNLIASGVQIEAESIEDNGEGVCFNVYCYNVQPGITIDYATGASKETSD